MEIILRTTFIYFFLLVLVRAMGRRELSEMSAFELLVLVTMGDLVQQGVTQEDMSVTGAVLAVSTFGVWSLVLSYITFRWRRTEPLLSGSPVLVVRNGEMLSEAMRVERVTVEEVKEAARLQGISDLTHVEAGIIEADGRFSFIRTDHEAAQSGPEERASE